jgi:ATP-dependent phosphoenolpyruvate carboxykinase
MPRIPPHSISPGPSVPAEILRPRESWADKSAYDATATKWRGFPKKVLSLTPQARAPSWKPQRPPLDG